LIVHLDTSLLVHALSTADGRGLLAAAFARGDDLALSSVVQYEWSRGPLSAEELSLADGLFPPARIVAFQNDEARTAARLYRQLPRARTRQMDFMIAACAIEHGAALWTLNPADFADIPELQLYSLP
jgi:predicted nucleic acid-binding protein